MIANSSQLAALRARVGGLNQPYRFRDRFNLAGFLDRLTAGQELEIEISRGGRLYQGTLELD